MCSRGCTCGCSPEHLRLQPRSHAVAGTLPGAACLASLERAGQSDNFELETHWRMLVLGGGAGAGTLAPPRPTTTPPHGPNTLRTLLRLLYLLTLPTYLLCLLYLLTLPLPCMCTRMHQLYHSLAYLRLTPTLT